jgi:CUG-BP- and ETR3-like factor
VKEALTKEQSRTKLEQEKRRKLFCINLDEQITQLDLSEYFSQFGKIVDTRIIKEQKKSKTKIFGFVLFDKIESLDKAIEASSQKIVKDCDNSEGEEEACDK